jgi:DNA ligase (NAD+)
MKEKVKVKKKTKISGKIFIFTGELSMFTRGQAQKIIEEQGAKWVSSISKNIDFVVTGQNPGSKHDKAKKLGLNIIDESQFRKLIGK